MSRIWEPQPRETYLAWVKDVLEEASDELSDWESGFIHDMETRLNAGMNLTQNQADKLEQIYAKYTD